MKTVFVGSKGNVVKLKDPHFGANDAGLIKFEELTSSSPAIIFTDMEEQFKPRYQVTDTLGNRTLLHTFGRSMNVRQIRGLCYEGFCEDADDKSGYEDLNKFFNDNNAIVRDTPVTMVIGKSYATKCFLLDMSVQLADPVARIWAFTASLIADPGTTEGALQQQERISQVRDNAEDEEPLTLIRISNRPGVPFFNTSSGLSTYTPTTTGSILRSGDPQIMAPVPTTTQRMTRQPINPFVAV